MAACLGLCRTALAFRGRGVLLGLLICHCGGLYDPVGHIESARLYGNIDHYAYYFVDLLVGTPPQRVSVIVDTGSGVCAFPCASCAHCGTHIDPAFDVAQSSTAKWQGCGAGCIGSCGSGHCSYYQGYTEGSSISGYWFEDMLRIGDNIQKNPAVKARMGCHQNENNLFYTQRANGILGIGPGSSRATILQELFKDKEHVEASIFSLCLAEWGGLLTVGGHNTSYHQGTIQWTHLRHSGYYHVSLDEMRIGDQLISASWGTTMIDSGTTYTYMRSASYRALKNGIESYCQNHNSCDSTHQGNCWTAKSLSKFPTVTVKFGSASTDWIPSSYMYKRGTSDRWCYAFEDDGAGADTTLGASWMRHKDIIFDMVNSRVGIVPAHCPEFRDRPAHNPKADMSLPEVPQATTTTTVTTSSTSTTVRTTSTTTPTTTSTTTSTTTPSTSTTRPPSTTSSTSTSSSTTTRSKVVQQSAITVAVTTSTRTVTEASPRTVGDQSHTTSLPTTTTTSTHQETMGEKAQHVKETAKESAFWAFAWLSDPSHRPVVAGVVLLWLILAGLTCYCLCRWCRRHREHRHFQLKESDDSGMPPQIVGANGAGDVETFVIGDDDVDAEDEGFEYVHDVEMAPATSSNASSPSPEGLRNTGMGSPRGYDVWDQGGL